MTPDFFSTSHFSRFNSFFSLIFCFSFCVCTALVQDQVINFLPVGVFFRLIINQFTWIWLFLTTFPAEVCEEQEWRVGFPRPRAYACIRCGASSRKRHGNRHAKPAGLRVPVRPNLRLEFLVKCSTSGGFFVNFYTLFFSTTSSILLRKV